MSTQSISKPMYTQWNLAVLCIIELSTPTYIAFKSTDDIIYDITNDELWINSCSID